MDDFNEAYITQRLGNEIPESFQITNSVIKRGKYTGKPVDVCLMSEPYFIINSSRFHVI